MKHERLYSLIPTNSLNAAKISLSNTQDLGYQRQIYSYTPSGIPIRRQTPRKTFNQVITMLGVEDVFNLGIRTPRKLLISNKPGRNQELEIAPGRYIQTAFSNRQKAEILLDIAERLDIELFIIDTATNNNLTSAWRTRDRSQIY